MASTAGFVVQGEALTHDAVVYIGWADLIPARLPYLATIIVSDGRWTISIHADQARHLLLPSGHDNVEVAVGGVWGQPRVGWTDSVERTTDGRVRLSGSVMLRMVPRIHPRNVGRGRPPARYGSTVAAQ